MNKRNTTYFHFRSLHSIALIIRNLIIPLSVAEKIKFMEFSKLTIGHSLRVSNMLLSREKKWISLYFGFITLCINLFNCNMAVLFEERNIKTEKQTLIYKLRKIIVAFNKISYCQMKKKGKLLWLCFEGRFLKWKYRQTINYYYPRFVRPFQKKKSWTTVCETWLMCRWLD